MMLIKQMLKSSDKQLHTLIPVNGIYDLLNGAEKKQYDIFINDILIHLNRYMDWFVQVAKCKSD